MRSQGESRHDPPCRVTPHYGEAIKDISKCGALPAGSFDQTLMEEVSAGRGW